LPHNRTTLTDQVFHQNIKMANQNDSPVNELLARLTQQQQALYRQKEQVDESAHDNSSSSSATDPYANTPPTESVANSDGRPDAAEVLRLQKELECAKERMAQMDLELTQSRITRHTVEEAIGSPFPAAQQLAFNIGGAAANNGQGRASPFRPGNQVQNAPGGKLWIDTGIPSGGDMYTPQQ